MSDLTWEKYREDLELSEKAFNDLIPIERANLKSAWRDEVRKQEEHEARMRQLLQEEQANEEKNNRDSLILKGNYFYSLEEVLPVEKIEKYPLDAVVKENDGTRRNDYANVFLRTTTPTYYAQGGKDGVQEFETTKTLMMTDGSLASADSQGHSSNAKRKIWNVDIFGRKLKDSKSSHVAHLLPDAPAHAVEWYDVACWAIGLDPENADWGTVLRMLHGTRSNDKKRSRQFGSGMRHFAANKSRVNGQELVLDKDDPQLMILPIRTRRECLGWNGGDYEAIVLVGANKNGEGQTWATKEIGMTDGDLITVVDADDKDLQTALLLLKECTLAMTQSLVNYDLPKVPEGANEVEKKLMEDASIRRAKRRDNFVTAVGEESVPVPKEDITIPTGAHRAVCKICFSNHANGLHPAPDPLLLIARATVVWSVRHGIRLRASAMAQDDSGFEEWEHDVLQIKFLANLSHAKKLKEEVEGLEVTVEQRGLQDSDNETLSVSSGESQEGQAVWKTGREVAPMRLM